MQPSSFHDLSGSTCPQVCGKTLLHFELLAFVVCRDDQIFATKLALVLLDLTT